MGSWNTWVWLPRNMWTAHKVFVYNKDVSRNGSNGHIFYPNNQKNVLVFAFSCASIRGWITCLRVPARGGAIFIKFITIHSMSNKLPNIYKPCKVCFHQVNMNDCIISWTKEIWQKLSSWAPWAIPLSKNTRFCHKLVLLGWIRKVEMKTKYYSQKTLFWRMHRKWTLMVFRKNRAADGTIKYFFQFIDQRSSSIILVFHASQVEICSRACSRQNKHGWRGRRLLVRKRTDRCKPGWKTLSWWISIPRTYNYQKIFE